MTAAAAKMRPPDRASEREASASAIVRADIARRRAAAAERRPEELYCEHDEAGIALQVAERAVAEAEKAAALRVAFPDDAPAPSVSAGQARAAVAALEARRALLLSARVEAAAEAQRLAQLAYVAEQALREAVTEVVIADPAVRNLIRRHREVMREFVDLRRAVELVQRGRLIPPDVRVLHSEDQEWANGQVETAWRSALALLAQDADAELPSA